MIPALRRPNNKKLISEMAAGSPGDGHPFHGNSISELAGGSSFALALWDAKDGQRNGEKQARSSLRTRILGGEERVLASTAALLKGLGRDCPRKGCPRRKK